MPYITSDQSTALREEIANSYADHPASYFAAKYGVGVGCVHSIASNLGVTSNQRWEAERETIISMYEAGVPVKAIGKELGHYHHNVTKKLVEWGIPIRTRTEGRMQYAFDTAFFKQIDSHEKAYWLGFVYADGNVYLNEANHKSVFQVALAKVDNGHLPKLRAALKDSRPMYDERGGERYMINNIDLVKDLIHLGVTPRKSLTTVFPTEDIVPAQYVNSFILGYFDGDGSIYIKDKSWGFSIIGTTEFVQAIEGHLRKSGLSEMRVRLEKRKGANELSYLTYTGSLYALNRSGCEHRRKHRLIPIYRYLYANSPVWLDRKRALFEKALTLTYGHDWQHA